MTRNPTSLTQRALLTFASQVLPQAVGMATGFVLTPVIVHGLGTDMYGVWGMVTKAVGLMGLSSLNTMGTLKLRMGLHQHSQDVEEKRRMIGSAVAQWCLLTPILVVASIALIHYAPRLIRTGPASMPTIRWVLAIMLFGSPVVELLSVPGAVLIGNNMEYKTVWLNVAMTVAGGLLNVAAIIAGYGLVALAGASMLSAVMLNVGKLVIARRNLPWFGLSTPSRRQAFAFTRLSVWVSLTTLAGLLLVSTDALAIGYFIGPGAVALYITTGALARYVASVLSQFLSSGNSGIAFLAGRGDWRTIEGLRVQMYQAALMGFTVTGAVVLLFNESFLRLWIGTGYYAGAWVTILIVGSTLIWQLAIMDAIQLDVVFQLSRKVIAMLVWSTTGLLSGIALCYHFGIAGMAAGSCIGYAGLLVTYQVLIQRHTGLNVWFHLRAIGRPLLLACLVLVACFLCSERGYFRARGWLDLVLGVGLTGTCALGVSAFAGLTPEARGAFMERIRSALAGRST